jgi:hypothetical protein
MLLQRLRHGFLRDIVSAMVLALVLLAGIAQARASTENAAHAGFAGAFELCLQSGKAGNTPAHPDHDCDECRLPGLSAALLPAALPQSLGEITQHLQPAAFGPQVATRPSFHPEARGPPARG